MNSTDYSVLQGKILCHPGKRILDALNAYTTSKNILSGNGLQLRQLIRILEDPADPAGIWPQAQRHRLHALQGEAIRHFHNFLASIKTLVDHTRNLMNESFVKVDHRCEYQSKVDTVFATDPLAQFMQDFRNYITHRAIPIVEMSYTILPEPEVCELNIDIEKMADWDGWKPPSRRFIEIHKPKVRMLRLVDDYEQKAKAFHEEFVLGFQHHYQSEIDAVLALMRECNGGLQNSKEET